MKSRAFALCILALASSLALPTSAFAACEAQSHPNTVALVELYTSEGCSSCPPADKRLSQLPQALGATADAIPLALHVGYWDSLGWPDPYARDDFSERQSWLVKLNRQAVVYTPHFFVGGTELSLQESALRDEVRRVNATTARASIHLEAKMAPNGALAVSADATTQARSAPVALYLAVAENGLTSKVTRGENGGATLAHDHVVRAWVGPIRLTSGGTVHVQRDIALPAGWNRDRLDVVAFVEDQSTGAVLQAVSAAQCARI
jgi:hypothetical protein